MSAHRNRLSLSAAAVGCLLIPALLSPAGAVTAWADDYPTWSEVEQAKGDAAATAAEAARITGLLDSLSRDAAALGDQAVQADASAARSRSDAEAATRTAQNLDAQAAAAKEQAADTTRQAGLVTARLSRAGDPTLALWLDGDPGDTLERLGRMERVTGSLSTLRDKASEQLAQATALGEQATRAAQARDALAADAESKAAAAAAARDAADARVREAQTQSDTLYAQLASLNNTSAEVERRYREGEQQKRSYEAPGNPGSPSVGSPTGTNGDESDIAPDGGSMSPAEARAYAAGQVAARGWGSGENQCLVWLWNRESSWRWNALNPSSGAYGIPQSLPGSKMASSGADWRTNAATQINWGLGYISSRYGTPCGAWAHSEDVGWY